MNLNRAPIVLAVLLFTLALGRASSADWPQWRGPTRDSVVADVQWPAVIDDSTLKPLWRVDLAEGYPGPIVFGDRVFTVETKDKKDEVVRAFDVKSGEQLWEKSWPAAMKVPFFAKRNGDWIKATPATDGERLYVMGMVDDLVCLDVATGNELWRVDFKKRYGTRKPQFGQACSPLIEGDAVYVQAGLSVCKIDKKTGETVWRAMHDARDFIGGNFSSPVIETIAGKRQLLVQTRGELAGLDLQTGDVLWRQAIKAFRGMNILPPTKIDDNHIFTSSYGGGSFLFRLTQNDEGGFDLEQLWNTEIEGYMSSPLVIDDHIYLHGRDKKLRCMKVETGEVTWTSEDEYGEYMSTVRNGKQILALGYDGTLRLINATPEKLDIVSEHKASEQETWGHLAVDGDRLYIRELKGLSVFQLAKPGGFD